MKVKLLDKDIVRFENEELSVREDILFLEDDEELAFAKFRLLYDFIEIPGIKVIDINNYIEKIGKKELQERAINELLAEKYIEIINV
jgi:hypothetical protein